MRPFHRFISFLAIFLLFAAITPCVSAFTISSVKVDPDGYQAAGTPVNLSFAIDFASTGNETFLTSDELQMSTNLVNPRWTPVLMLNGMETSLPSKNGNVMILPGWYLSYPSTERVQVRVKLTGTMPADSVTDRNFLKIQELDSGSAIVSTASLGMPDLPVTTRSAPLQKTTTKKPATKTPTPVPVQTSTQKSPLWIGAGIAATCGAALLFTRKK